MINRGQRVAILIDGNNLERSIAGTYGNGNLLNYDTFIPKVLGTRSLTHFFYFREGKKISEPFSKRLQDNFYGVTKTCNKSADIPLTIQAVQLGEKVDTLIIFSGDSDYEHLILYLQNKGVRVEICGLKKSTSSIMTTKRNKTATAPT